MGKKSFSMQITVNTYIYIYKVNLHRLQSAVALSSCLSPPKTRSCKKFNCGQVPKKDKKKDI